MAFLDEIIKHQRQRSVYLDFSASNNPTSDWEGAVTRLYGTAYDDMGPIPIKGTATSFGTFARSVLSMELDLELPSVTVELIDDNNEWRAMAEPPSTQLLYRWVHLMMRVLDDDEGFFDQKVAIGQIIDPQFPPGKRVALTLQLAPGLALGEDLPRRLISMRDFPRCPPENVGKVVPVIYGVMSNTVRTATETAGVPDPDGVITSCSDYGLTVLWGEDNFNGPGTLAADGYDSVFDVAKVAGIGPDGSQAVRSIAPDLGLFERLVAPTGRSGSVSFASKTTAAGGEWSWVAEVRQGGSWIISIYRNDDPVHGGDNTLEIYFRHDSGTALANIANFWDDTTWHDYQFSWSLSTYNGSGYDLDGAFCAYKDGALMYSVVGILLTDGSPGFPQAWDTINLSPQGDLDNLTIYDAGLTTVVAPALSGPDLTSRTAFSMGMSLRVPLAWIGVGGSSATGIYQAMYLRLSSSNGTFYVRVNLGRVSSSTSEEVYRIAAWYSTDDLSYTPLGTVNISTASALDVTALENRSQLPWDSISLHVESSTRSSLGVFADDGSITVRRGGAVFGTATGLNIPAHPDDATFTPRWHAGIGDIDDLWYGNDTSGVRAWTEDFNWLDEGEYSNTGAAGTTAADFAGQGYTGNVAVAINTDGGASGPNYAAFDTNPATLAGSLYDGPFTRSVPAAITLGGSLAPRLGCTASDTGTGPSMAAGAVRAILVDTGITTSISVQSPPPPPGEVVLDTSIEAMSAGAANERVGEGSINVPTFYLVAPLMSDGRIGPLSPIMDLDQSYDPDYPAHDAVISWSDITTTPDSWVVWMMTDFNFHPVSNPEPGARIRIIPGTPYTNPTWPPGNPHDYQVVFTSVDDGDPWETYTPLPPGGGGPTLVTGFSGYRYLLAGHTLYRVNEVYVRRPVLSLAPASPTEPPPDPDEELEPGEVAPEPETITTEMQVLQMEGTDYVQEIIEINGNRYHTLRFFAAMQSDDCTTQYEVTANVEGAETNADGTGVLITNGVEMVEHILLNWVFNNYRSSVGAYAPPGGRWYTDVPYAPGLVDHASFIAAMEASYSFATVLGYQGAGMMIEQQTGTALVTDLMRTFGLDFFFDPMSVGAAGNGAWSVKLWNPAETGRGVQTILHPHPPSEAGYIGIVAGSFALAFRREWHRNVMQYFAGPMYGMVAAEGITENGGYTVSNEISDPESIQAYGLITGEPLYLLWTRDPETAYSVAYRLLRQQRYPPIVAEVVTPLSALTVSPSSEVAVTHPDGTGLTGWTDRICRVQRLDIDFNAMTCRMTLRDVDDLVP